jgi:hypothetical protein
MGRRGKDRARDSVTDRERLSGIDGWTDIGMDEGREIGEE